jgi:hypothetical protein
MFGVAGLTLTLAWLPIWMSSWWRYNGYIAQPSIDYCISCIILIPLLHAFLCGVGLALVIVGKMQTRCRRDARYLLALSVNIAVFAILIREVRVIRVMTDNWIY